MRRPEQGFILIVVLVALVVLSLLAGAVALVSERAVAEARADAEAFQGEIAMTSTRDTLLYMLNTQHQTFGGLTVDKQVVWSAGQASATPEDGEVVSQLPIGNEIRLDGTPYLGLDGASFALQDDAGLFSPNWAFDYFRPGFFQLLGIPATGWAGMEARRLDYQDPDNLVRLGGAEAEQYEARDFPPPTNRTLVTPLEVRRILGWGDALADRDDAQLASFVTAARTVMININTAPATVLQTIPGVDAATAARIIAMRQASPFMLGWQFQQAFNLPIDQQSQPVGLLAVGYGTLKLWHNAGGPVHLIHWTLTPIDEGGRPWRLDYEITLPRDEVADSDLARAPQTPLFPGPPATGG